MALVIADRVRETTSSVGTGTLTLTGAFSGFQPFSVIGNGNTTYYCIIDATNGAWEVGIGTYTTSGNTLSRDTVLSSSNSDSLVSFASGLKDVICTQPAERAVYLDTASNTTIPGITLSGGTANGVAYLNGSKVLTTGSALTFDGSQFKVASNQATNSVLLTRAGYFELALQTTSTGGADVYTKYTGPEANTDWLVGSSYVSGVSRALRFVYNGSEQMRLTSTGLGIGTSSPGEKLEIAGKVKVNTAFPQIILNRTATSYQSDIKFTLNGTNQWSIGQALGAVGSNLEFYDYGASATRMVLDTAGNLGLGVTPSAWGSGFKAFENIGGALYSGSNSAILLGQNFYYNGTNNIYKNTNLATAYSQNAGVHAWFTAPSGTAGNAISFTQAMTLDASGDLKIGTTASGRKLRVAGEVGIGNDSSNAYELYIAQTSSYARIGPTYNAGGSYVPLTFWTSDTERARIDSSGNLLVGTTSGSNRLTVSSSANDYISRMYNTNATGSDMLYMQSTADPNNSTYKTIYTLNNASARFYVQSNGGIGNYQANNVNLSDRREKTNFAPAGEYLSKICAIPVQTFNYIDQNMEEDAGLTLGVVAQDVQAVAPELVMESNWGTEENPKMRLSVYQTDLQYALMKCIQEQQAIINQLKARLDAANL